MSNSGVQGTRVAEAIGASKWVLIGLAIVSGGTSALAVAIDTDFSVQTRVYVVLAIVIGAALWSLIVWVLFGWFEHTLLALIAIARNTSAVQASYTSEVPPAPYEQGPGN